MKDVLKKNCFNPATVACLPLDCDKGVTLAIEHDPQEHLGQLMFPLISSCLLVHSTTLAALHIVPLNTLSFPELRGIVTHGIQRYTVDEFLQHHQLAVHESTIIYDVFLQRNSQPHPHTSQSKLCSECFGEDSTSSDPLSISRFHLSREWQMYVPLPIRLLFQSMFINADYLKVLTQPGRCNGKEPAVEKSRYLQRKMAPLLQQLDGLISMTHNNHVGIIQEINTYDLAMNSSITSMFDVTSHAKCTRSHSSAEVMLKALADPDTRLHYTYEKAHPLLYQPAGGTMAVHQVTLRDCHTVMMVDNLVRLAFRRDAEPGKKHTETLRTLPITREGLPKDSVTAEHCHQAGCVRESCRCKEPRTLTIQQITYALLNPTPEEKMAHDTFYHQSTWGLGPLMKKALDDPKFKAKGNHNLICFVMQ